MSSQKGSCTAVYLLLLYNKANLIRVKLVVVVSSFLHKYLFCFIMCHKAFVDFAVTESRGLSRPCYCFGCVQGCTCSPLLPTDLEHNL